MAPNKSLVQLGKDWGAAHDVHKAPRSIPCMQGRKKDGRHCSKIKVCVGSPVPHNDTGLIVSVTS